VTLAALRQCVKFNVPIFAGGGVYQASQAQALLQAGAAAVQLDAALWRSLGGWPADQKPSGGAATTR
jgi:dihydroorotate dehydrogenase